MMSYYGRRNIERHVIFRAAVHMATARGGVVNFNLNCHSIESVTDPL